MATEVERLTVSLEASVKRFENELAKARNSADRNLRDIERRAETSAKRIETAFGGIGSRIKDGVSGIGGLLGGGALLGAASLTGTIATLKDTAAAVAKIGDTSDKIGITAEELQALGYASEQAGGSVEAVDSGLVKFSKNVSDAGRGTGDLYELFKANGVAIKDTEGNLRPTTVLLGVFADLIKNAKNPADQLALATAAFGKSAGPDLVPLLQSGSEGIRQMTDEARQAGAVIGNEVVKKAQELDDKFAKLTAQISTATKTGLLEGAGALQTYSNEALALATVIGATLTGIALNGLAASLATSAAGALTAARAMTVLQAASAAAALAARGLQAVLAFFGPVGLTLAILSVAFVTLGQRIDEATRSAQVHDDALREIDAAIAQVKGGVDGAVAKLKQLGDAHLVAARKAVEHAKAEAAAAEAFAATANNTIMVGAGEGAPPAPADVANANNDAERATARRALALKQLAEIEERVSNAGKVVAESPPPRTTIIPNKGSGSGGGSDSEKLNEYEKEVAAIQKRTRAFASETETVSKSAFEVAKAEAAFKLLEAAGKANIPVTDTLRDKVDGLATAYATAKVALDEAEERQQKFQAASRQFGSTLSDGFSDAILNGEKLINVMDRLLKSLASRGIDSLFDSLFAKGGAGSNLLGSLASGLGGGLPAGGFNFSGFDSGGYTGPGRRNRPRGIVHAGEVVWNQDDVRRGGGVGAVEAMRRGGRGYAGGGIVTPMLPTSPGRLAPPRAAGRPVRVALAPTYNITPAKGVTLGQLAVVLAQREREMTRTLGERMAQWRLDN